MKITANLFKNIKFPFGLIMSGFLMEAIVWQMNNQSFNAGDGFTAYVVGMILYLVIGQLQEENSNRI